MALVFLKGQRLAGRKRELMSLYVLQTVIILVQNNSNLKFIPGHSTVSQKLQLKLLRFHEMQSNPN